MTRADEFADLLKQHLRERRQEIDVLNRRRLKSEDYVANSGRHDELDKFEAAIESAIKKTRGK